MSLEGYLPLKELRVVPMNTAIAPAPSSLTESIMRFVSRCSWVRTHIPPVNSRDVSIDAADIVNLKSRRESEFDRDLHWALKRVLASPSATNSISYHHS